MTDNELMIVLYHHAYNDKSCAGCPLAHIEVGCTIELTQHALSLINRQKAEIDKLKILLNTLYGARAETIKEFAERVKRYIDVGHLRPPTEKCFSELDVVNMIDNLLKEMAGDSH